MAGVHFPAGARDISLIHNVQTNFGVHPVSYHMGAGGYFPGEKVADHHLHLVPRSRMMELYLHFPYVFMACCLIH
jgi:hypothetical protein